MDRLDGKVALVTGASAGIGAACALALAQAGCHVALIAARREALDRMAEIIRRGGGLARAYPCDVGNAQAVADTVSLVEKDMGPVAILVNNAVAGAFKPLSQMSLAEAMQTVDSPLGAALAACHSVVPGMIARRQGHIVNLSSPAAYVPLPYMVPYTAGRHAMMGLSLSLREELAQHGVGVSLLCPSKVDARHFEQDDADYVWHPRMSKFFPALQPAQISVQVLKAIRSNSRELIFPLSLRIWIRLYQLAPRFNLWLLKKLGLFQPLRS